MNFTETDTSGILTVDFSRNNNGGLLLTILDGGNLCQIPFEKKLPTVVTRTVTLCHQNYYNIELNQFSKLDYKLFFGLTASLWKRSKSRFNYGELFLMIFNSGINYFLALCPPVWEKWTSNSVGYFGKQMINDLTSCMNQQGASYNGPMVFGRLCPIYKNNINLLN